MGSVLADGRWDDNIFINYVYWSAFKLEKKFDCLHDSKAHSCLHREEVEWWEQKLEQRNDEEGKNFNCKSREFDCVSIEFKFEFNISRVRFVE